MYSDLIKELINYAFDHGISVRMIKAPISMPCTAFVEDRLIVININWKHPNQVPFAMAHEIAHMTNQDDIFLYKSPSCMYRITSERSANVTALNILLPMYFKIVYDYSMDDVRPIMYQLGIPFNLYSEIRKHLNKQLWYVHS